MDVDQGQRLALYRRYRPETFAEVVGQSHVTEPLRAALANNRVNHAYLFSGPRGCGKTTSARILARALNCEQAPIADPCGQCQSCQELSRDGGGSIDVIEIDAASHGGVDDARDLRERAFFAPVRSRYKVYIIDEAHMVSTQGFNALLKLVEEPPEHLKFIFATTEPDKVIPTIRSRTHHYPFHLIPPRVLGEHLGEICAAENVAIDPGALQLVVRAGAGSVRDAMSVLDQLISGSGSDGVTYDLATALLGYTPDSLLDEIVTAIASRQGHPVFAAVDKVIESGQDPRRFTEDLLRRLRDLVIVAAVPNSLDTGLVEAAPSQVEALKTQAGLFSPAELVFAADTVAEGLNQMRGATSPRLLLELMCARLLVSGPGAAPQPAASPPTQATQPTQPTAPATAPAPAPAATTAPPASTEPVTPPATAAPAAQAAAHQPASSQPSQPPAHPDVATPETTSSPPAAPTAPAPQATPSQAAPSRPAETDTGQASPLAQLERMWPQVLEAVKGIRRYSWMLLSQHAHVVDIGEDTVTIGFVQTGARDSFLRGTSTEELQSALAQVLGGSWNVEAVIDHGESAGAARPQAPSPRGSAAPSAATGAPTEQSAPSAAGPPQPARSGEPAAASAPPPTSPPRAAAAPVGEPLAAADPPPREPTAAEPRAAAPPRRPDAAAAARQNISPTGYGRAQTPAQGADERDAEISPDDPSLEDTTGNHQELLERELGAVVIDETPND